MSDLIYDDSTSGLALGKYDIEVRRYAKDPVIHKDLSDLADLAASPDWEDRIRAEVLRVSTPITLPDQFPCIFETPDSPNRRGVLRPQPFAWVVSPDIDMLRDLINDYQELWDAYTSQWGPSSRRTMAIGRLDGLPTRGVYRPGTTPEQVIGETMLVHTEMYGRAPQRLKRMHPMHYRWHPEDERADA